MPQAGRLGLLLTRVAGSTAEDRAGRGMASGACRQPRAPDRDRVETAKGDPELVRRSIADDYVPNLVSCCEANKTIHKQACNLGHKQSRPGSAHASRDEAGPHVVF